MSRHLRTFRRHRIALILPVIICVVLSGWYALSRPHKYESVMSVWFDNPAPSQSSLVAPSPYTTPAGQGEAVLKEFLATQQFLVSVGHRGPLAGYLTRQNAGHPGGSSSLLSKITGVFHHSSGPAPTLDDQIVSTLLKAFSVQTNGPQIVQVTISGSDPSWLPGTLNAVASEYQTEISTNLQIRTSASRSYYNTELASAKQALDQADAALTAYQSSHPNTNPVTDSTYGQLDQAARQAQTNYDNIQGELDQSGLSVSSVQTPAVFHVVDPATTSIELSSKKHDIFIVIAGLLGGVVISLLALSALTSADKTVRDEDDVVRLADLEVAAVILPGPRPRALPAPRKAQSS